MIEHIVFFRPHPDATDEALERMLAALRSLKGNLPGIVELSCGVTICPERGAGYQVALRALFSDREALEARQSHPFHRQVMQSVWQWAQDVAAIDFTV